MGIAGWLLPIWQITKNIDVLSTCSPSAPTPLLGLQRKPETKLPIREFNFNSKHPRIKLEFPSQVWQSVQNHKARRLVGAESP